MNTIFKKDTKFTTGSFKSIILADIVYKINDFLNDDYDYSIEIGTDSQKSSGKVKFVTAIVVHKIGKGGIFFYHPIITNIIHSLSDRIYMETQLSISCADELIKIFIENNVLYSVIIHCDVGKYGKTKDLIQGVMGYVAASGFPCKIKPESTAACTVADRYSK